MKRESLPELLFEAARLAGQVVPRERQDAVRRALAAAPATASAAALAAIAWSAAHLKGGPSALESPHPHDCPFLAWHPDRGWLVILTGNADKSWRTVNAAGDNGIVPDLADMECAALPERPAAPESRPRAGELIGAAVWERKGVFLEAVLATLLVNVLALCGSLYTMQVYDRVIPNHGFQTLWVLSAGVVLAVLLELMLKHVRGYAIERTAMRIDADLSNWFFARTMGIRMDRRPPAVGTLASQIKGFEMVRSLMSASSMFMLADVPFALFFIGVIWLVGGSLVIVPLVLLPLSILTGLMFQRQVGRHTRDNQGQTNRKAGLLVESIAGAESLKANAAESLLQSRWGALVRDAGLSDYRIKHYSALSQHMTMAIQQTGYVALVAFGAYLVTQNQLTMGALIACTIINGRALGPVAQLPLLMVQWEHARAAVQGLDKLIALPNELDDAATALTPRTIERSLRLDRARFSYAGSAEPAIDIPRLEISQGEKVAILGAVGSGKSTLLKIASGLYRPEDGRVLLGGIDMAVVARPVVREAIAYVPQDISLVSGTLRDNILQGLPDPGDEAILEAARQTGLIQAIATHPNGLALPVTEGGCGLSGGQRQLVALTRMLLARAPLLMLDEPTACMDAVTEARTVAILAEQASAGATLLIATHKSALLPLVDRVLVMQGGKLVMDGPREAVLAHLAGQRPGPVIAPARTAAAA